MTTPEATPKAETSQPRPGGIFHGWYILAAIFFISVVSNGARNAFGAFVLPMETDFQGEHNNQPNDILTQMARLAHDCICKRPQYVDLVT